MMGKTTSEIIEAMKEEMKAAEKPQTSEEQIVRSLRAISLGIWAIIRILQGIQKGS